VPDGDHRTRFPRAELRTVEGWAGAVGYGAADCVLDDLEGRLDTLRWTADAASIGSAWLRDQAGRFDISVERVEMPRGLRLVRAMDQEARRDDQMQGDDRDHHQSGDLSADAPQIQEACQLHGQLPAAATASTMGVNM